MNRSIKSLHLALGAGILGGVLMGGEPAHARFIPTGSVDLCEVAEKKRDQRIKNETDLVDQVYDLMELERAAYAECMNRINQIVGEQISSPSLLGEAFGAISKSFNYTEELCKSVADRVKQEQSKIKDRIDDLAKVVGPYASQAAQALENSPQVKDAINQAKDSFIQSQGSSNNAPAPASAANYNPAPPPSATPSFKPQGTPNQAPATNQPSNSWEALSNLINKGG